MEYVVVCLIVSAAVVAVGFHISKVAKGGGCSCGSCGCGDSGKDKDKNKSCCSCGDDTLGDK